MIPEGTGGEAEDYRNYFAKAEALVYSSLPSQMVVKTGEKKDTITDRKTQKQKSVVKWFLQNEKGESMVIKPRQHGLKPCTNGQCFDVKKDGDRIVFVSPIATPSSNWIKAMSGKTRLLTNPKGKHFAFVDDCYVHEKLLAGVADGDTIEVTAVRKDGKWSAVNLRKI